MIAAERVNKLVSLIQENFKDWQISLDPPDNPKGTWFIDLKEQKIVVEFRPKLDFFGLSHVDSRPTYGESGVDIIFETEEAVIEYLKTGRNPGMCPKIIEDGLLCGYADGHDGECGGYDTHL